MSLNFRARRLGQPYEHMASLRLTVIHWLEEKTVAGLDRLVVDGLHDIEC